MEISIDRESGVPLYLQIAGGIRRLVLAGRLPDGFRLPPERLLARSLGVNRSTVLAAYRELKGDGLVDAHVGRGTVLVPRQIAASPEPVAEADGPDLAWRPLMREAALRERDPLVRNLLELTENRDLVSLSIGLPAPELIPLAELAAISASLLADPARGTLLHSPTEGVTSFRETVGQLMTRRGRTAPAAEVLITSGSQQGLDLVTRAFVDPGDAVVVEEPSYFGALTVFRAAGARLLGVPADRDGMRPDALEAVLSRHRPKLVYVLPTFQNPSGAVLSLERRKALLDLAYRFQVPVVEDDPYADLRYDGEPLPSLHALDRRGHVVYLSSFSKLLFPGLRLGWIAAPRPVVRQLALLKQMVDLHSSTFGQQLVDRFVREGHLARHVETVRRAYAARRDVMVEALREACGDELAFTRPEGGFYVWCRLPSGVPEGPLLAEAARLGVSFLPGGACFVDEPAAAHVRLNFSAPSPRAIRDGVSRLARAVAAVRSAPGSRGDRGGGTPPIV